MGLLPCVLASWDQTYVGAGGCAPSGKGASDGRTRGGGTRMSPGGGCAGCTCGSRLRTALPAEGHAAARTTTPPQLLPPPPPQLLPQPLPQLPLCLPSLTATFPPHPFFFFLALYCLVCGWSKLARCLRDVSRLLRWVWSLAVVRAQLSSASPGRLGSTPACDGCPGGSGSSAPSRDLIELNGTPKQSLLKRI